MVFLYLLVYFKSTAIGPIIHIDDETNRKKEVECARIFREHYETSGIALLSLGYIIIITMKFTTKDFCRRVKMGDGPEKSDIQQVFKRLRSAAANKV